jgi:hypothetical protein
MAWAAPEADVYVVCLVSRREGEDKQAGIKWVGDFVETVRAVNGKIQLLSSKPESWEVWEGKDHLVEPNHLNPAVFGFNTIAVAAFPDEEVIHAWWGSDMVFKMMQCRTPIDTLGVFVFDGLAKATDITDAGRIAFGDKYVLFEFHKMLCFKPVQQYCDNFRRYCEVTRVQPILSDSVKNTLVNEFPLDAVCATAWKQTLEAKLWRDSDIFKGTMVPSREQHSLCLGVLVPMYEASLADIHKARKLFALKDTMKAMSTSGEESMFVKHSSVTSIDVGKKGSRLHGM